MQLTLALLELPTPPAMPGVPLDPEARAKAIEILARMTPAAPSSAVAAAQHRKSHAGALRRRAAVLART